MKIDKMVLTEDSRPFTVLRKSAEDFKSLFNDGIETCLSTLDSGISDLLCDPDSLVGSSANANRLSAHMEFSKAKYELFVKMREYFEKFEKDCVEQISEMKEMFLENVEIFLAGTKLEVKLPTSETLSQIEKRRSPGSKVRSGNSPTTSPASSLYPKLIDSAKKQISRLSSFLPNADDSEIIDDDEEENQQSIFTLMRQNGKSPKRVTIVTPQEMEILEAARGATGDSAVIDISEDSDEEPGIIEEVPVDEINLSGNYLPHRPVLKESSTSIGPVFDATARMKGHPEKKIGVTADIRKAFLQISICEEDRDFLRFLWWKNKDCQEHKVFCRARVVFGVRSSPFLLKAVLKYHLPKNCDVDPFVTKCISNSFYVDNLLISVHYESELKRLINVSNELMKKGDFELWDWESSAPIGVNSKAIDLLGLKWNKSEDILSINLKWLKEVNIEIITKCTMLSATHKVLLQAYATKNLETIFRMGQKNHWISS
ncbi:hypothetical protein AVEN_253537-1 [Araneus ventricosus]|uniref:Reverse transcriptase domain-containing protein n=1 Tax=Araneus ventricosus TaxID=182803 RepID=A0A4Y2BSN4_ARAVE|nr:hypothetical protein AVEN_253537-1 [Araneus ventricosus]